MTPSLLYRALRSSACALALLLLVGPAVAQDNLSVLSNFGRGDGESRSVFALGSRAYYGIGNRLVISDFSTPQSPTTLGSATVPDRVEDVIVVGNTAYVASGGGVTLFNVQNPTQINELTTVVAESYGEGIAVDPPYILLGDGSAGLRILDATTPSAPTEVAQVDTLGYVEGVSYSGNIAYVAAGSRIHLIDYSTPGSPTYAGRIGSPLDYYQSSVVRGSFLYVADFFGGFRVFDVSTPSNPRDVGFFDPADRTARISLDGNYAYVANGDKGVTILDISTPASPTEGGRHQHARPRPPGPGERHARVHRGHRGAPGLRHLDAGQPRLPEQHRRAGPRRREGVRDQPPGRLRLRRLRGRGAPHPERLEPLGRADAGEPARRPQRRGRGAGAPSGRLRHLRLRGLPGRWRPRR